jgi:ABC-2 type transport system ATP-binding protein
MMHEVENISSYIGIMNHGRIIANGTIEELKSTLNRGLIRLTVSGKTDVSLEDLEGFIASRNSVRNLIIDLQPDVRIEKAVSELTSRGFRLLDLEHVEPLLEDVFIELTKNIDSSPEK